MTTRKEIINMRTSTEEKLFLQKAAEVAGFSNLTNFIMTAARKEALRIVSEQNTSYLSAHDWDLVNKLISNSPKPNAQLRKLLSKKKDL